MAERKPQRPKASELLTTTIETDTNHGAYTKLDELNKHGVTNVTNKDDAVSYRRKN